MPELDYALLADFVRSEGGLAHVIGASVDTIHVKEVPTGLNFGLLARIGFRGGAGSDSEHGRSRWGPCPPVWCGP